MGGRGRDQNLHSQPARAADQGPLRASSGTWDDVAKQTVRPPTALRDKPPASHGRDRPAVDDVFRTVDRGGAVRRQECDQLGNLLGLSWTAERNAAKRL